MSTNNAPVTDKQSDNYQEKPSFWLLHFLGWFGYFILFLGQNALIAYPGKGDGLYMAFPLFVSASMAAILTIPLRYIYQRCWHLKSGKLLATIVLCSLVVALIWTPLKNYSLWFILSSTEMANASTTDPEKSESLLMLFKSVNYSLSMIFSWSTLYFSINYYYRLGREKEMHLAALRLSHSAQIKMLRYQINPHFLFNTLNAISTLVLQGKKEKANGMLIRLSTFLRFSLDNDPEKKIGLYEELKALMLYLEIERTRFDDRLSVHFDIDSKAENLLVPSLLLQPLVENSIKYAIAKMAGGGEISISAKIINHLLHLEVADNGPDAEAALLGQEKLSLDDCKGVGLRNIRERLLVLYPNKHQFSVTKNLPTGLRVIIEIPIEEP